MVHEISFVLVFNDTMIVILITITSLRLVDYLSITLGVVSTKNFRIFTENVKAFPTDDVFAGVVHLRM